MSVRRRNIRERVERERKRREDSEAFRLSLQQIQDAITAAVARGETTCTDRFLQEAFGAGMETIPCSRGIHPQGVRSVAKAGGGNVSASRR